MILPEAEFERLRDPAEDALDAQALDASQARLDALRAAVTPLAFWRARRGLAPDALAWASAVEGTVLAAIERGDVTGESAVYTRLARVLDVDVEDLVPAA